MNMGKMSWNKHILYHLGVCNRLIFNKIIVCDKLFPNYFFYIIYFSHLQIFGKTPKMHLYIQFTAISNFHCLKYDYMGRLSINKNLVFICTIVQWEINGRIEWRRGEQRVPLSHQTLCVFYTNEFIILFVLKCIWLIISSTVCN